MVIAACSTGGQVSSTMVPEAAMTSDVATTEVLEEKTDQCVEIKSIGDALVLLRTDLDEKIAMAETLTTSEDARQMGISMATSITDLRLAAVRVRDVADDASREDVANSAIRVETGLRQTANNYKAVVDALIEDDAAAMAGAVADFDRLQTTIFETMSRFARLLDECPGA